MKAIHWLWLAISLGAAASVEARLAETISPKFIRSWDPRLTELNQSQIEGTLSMADRSSGLPANSYQTAAVHFIAGNSGQDFSGVAKDNDFTDPTGENCKRLGFSVTSCASGLFNKFCPYNDRIYDRCCDAAYKYAASQCPSPKILSSDTCGGKYKCYCSSSTYPFAACNAPQIKGSSCTDDSGTRYQTCSCPTGVSTPYGCQEYYASPCNSVCKTAYADNCRNRTAVQTPYGCVSYFSDCSSKCQTAYPDNCRNRAEVISGCPSNATCSRFSDCSSKIQSWACNTGYVKSGNACIVENPCPGFEKKTACPNKYYIKEVCNKDKNYLKCTPTCGARIVDANPAYAIDEYGSGVVVITKDGTYLPGNITYSNVNFPQYSECASLPKPKITLSASDGRAASIAKERLENVDIIVNFTPFSAPDYCYDANSFKNSSFCSNSSGSGYGTDCETRSGCMSEDYCRNYSWQCQIYYDAMMKYGHTDLCNIAENYDSYCSAPANPTVGLDLGAGKQIRTETYSNSGKTSTRYIWEGTYKNVNITVNGNPQIAVKIGGGAHYDKTVKFEGSNRITGGSRYSVWARGHNTYAYGIVRGVLQVNSGASLALGKEACIYNQWNGVVVRNGTISGTVTQNCATYRLTW